MPKPPFQPVDAWVCVRQEAAFEGTIPLDRMARLKALLAEPEGLAPAVYQATFGVAETREPLLELRVKAELPLRCQRSLQVYQQPVDIRTRLGLAASEAAMAEVPGHLEATLVPEDGLVLAELVEDELILALPMVPRDPGLDPVYYSTREGGEGGDEEAEEDEASSNPFQALEALRKQR